MTQTRAKRRRPSKPAKESKPYWEMNTVELREATKEFDREFVFDKFKPLAAADRRRFARAEKKMARPKIGQAAKVISVSVEQGLLQRADAWAKDHDLSRAQLVARGLELAMAGALQKASG
jgi:hypothetical protein